MKYSLSVCPLHEGRMGRCSGSHALPDQAIETWNHLRAVAKSGAALWGSVDRMGVLEPGPHYRWERVEDVLDALTLELH